MWVNNIEFVPDESSIDPRFSFRIDYEYYQNAEVPLMFYGNIKSKGGMKIATINCEHDIYGGNNFLSIPLADAYKGLPIDRNQRTRLSRNFNAVVTQKSIAHLEDLRLKDSTKSVFLNIELEEVILKYEQSDRKELKVERNMVTRQIKIEQSIWLQQYAQPFGLGEFLLIEFPKQKITVDSRKKNLWIERLERSKQRLDEMEAFLKEGRWDKVIETSRKIWDIFKFHNTDTELKDEFKILFEESNYSDAGFQNFLDSIWSLHEFASKFLHEKPKKGNELNPMLSPKKEDAYFIHLWTMGFINLVNEKVKNKL